MSRPATADLEALLRDEELPIRVVDLDTWIEISRTLGRARDAIVVPLLIAIRDRKEP